MFRQATTLLCGVDEYEEKWKEKVLGKLGFPFPTQKADAALKITTKLIQ
jgi:hypothetical protein